MSSANISSLKVFSMNIRNVIYYSEHGQEHPGDHPDLMVWMGLTGNGLVLGSHFAQRRLGYKGIHENCTL